MSSLQVLETRLPKNTDFEFKVRSLQAGSVDCINNSAAQITRAGTATRSRVYSHSA